jgi:hypothetical protein
MRPFCFEAIGLPNGRQATAGRVKRSGIAATPSRQVHRDELRLTFDKAQLLPVHRMAWEACSMQTQRQAAKSRPDAQTLSRALTIAWDLLVAADDPATAGERAEETRRRMARQLVRVADTSDDMTDLWMAALNAVVEGNAFKRAS